MGFFGVSGSGLLGFRREPLNTGIRDSETARTRDENHETGKESERERDGNTQAKAEREGERERKRERILHPKTLAPRETEREPGRKGTEPGSSMH